MADYQIDFILNGRFTKAESQPRLLAEIIRADDGAHVWVQYFEAGTDDRTLAERIVQGLEESGLSNQMLHE